MRLSLHISPTRTQESSLNGLRSARTIERCDDIAEYLREVGVDVEIVDTPAAPNTPTDFSLVFAADLEWHLTEGRRSPDRLVVLHADRDEILEIVERRRVAAAVYYMEPDALKRVGNGIVVRRDVAVRLGGTLGPGAPYFMASEHYAAWKHPAYSSQAEYLVAYLRAYFAPQAPALVLPSNAQEHGLTPVTIRIDAKGAGMAVRLFPTKDTYVALNGPPGAPIAVIVWDCTGTPDIETAIRSKVAPPWTTTLEVGAPDTAALFGDEQPGMTYATGAGRTRMVWFGTLVKRGAATVLVSLGVSGSEGRQVRASEVLANSMIRAAVSTLSIE